MQGGDNQRPTDSPRVVRSHVALFCWCSPTYPTTTLLVLSSKKNATRIVCLGAFGATNEGGSPWGGPPVSPSVRCRFAKWRMKRDDRSLKRSNSKSTVEAS